MNLCLYYRHGRCVKPQSCPKAEHDPTGRKVCIILGDLDKYCAPKRRA